MAGGFARLALEHAGRATACSEDLRLRMVRLGAEEPRTRTIAYGVDSAQFAPKAPASMRERLGAAGDATLVLAVGRLVEKKGLGTLVQAAAGVPGLRVAIAGEGDLREALRQQAAELRAPVTFAGNLDRMQVAEALAAADVVAVPSVIDRAGNVDGLPNVLLEAMAAGKAVVASRVAGIPDVVEDGVNGILVPPGAVEALREALTRLAGDAALRARLGAAARATVVARHGWPLAGRRFEECYAEAAALVAG
jgi:glycosyltransferase involved in cell wall biosynthesis